MQYLRELNAHNMLMKELMYHLGGTQYPIPLGSGSEECQKDQTT